MSGRYWARLKTSFNASSKKRRATFGSTVKESLDMLPSQEQVPESLENAMNTLTSFVRKELTAGVRRRASDLRTDVLLAALGGALLAALWEPSAAGALGHASRYLALGAASLLVGVKVWSAAGGAAAGAAVTATAAAALVPAQGPSWGLGFCGVAAGAAGAARLVWAMEGPHGWESPLAAALGFVLVPVGRALVLTAAGAGAGVLVGLAVGVALRAGPARTTTVEPTVPDPARFRRTWFGRTSESEGSTTGSTAQPEGPSDRPG